MRRLNCVPVFWTSLFVNMPLINPSTTTFCGEVLRAKKGFISTPNFPGIYPVPIECQWVIMAESHEVIALYFTQFYMRSGVKATEYTYFSPALHIGVGGYDYGTISSEKEPTYLVTNKPVLVLNMNLRTSTNVHMRVLDFLLDASGFNITYEIIGKNSGVRKDNCLYHHCSFNGNCLVSRGFENYTCVCFGEYFGDECQYDRRCGPDESMRRCQNGGTCRYYIGSTVRTCECTEGYVGARCEMKQPVASTAAEASCNALEDEEFSGYYTYFPIEGYCLPLESNYYKVELKVKIQSEFQLVEKDVTTVVKDLLTEALLTKQEQIQNLTFAQKENVDTINFQFIAKNMTYRDVANLIDIVSFYFDIIIEPGLRIQRVAASEKMPIVEGTSLVLACTVQGSPLVKIEWFKDGGRIHIQVPHRRIWRVTIPKNSEHQYTALLGFDRSQAIDTGEFTCNARDGQSEENASVSVIVRSTPQPQLSPMTATLRGGDRLVIMCLSREDIFFKGIHYTWLKNGNSIVPGRDPEIIEDLFPAGSRLIVDSVDSSANYTCILTGVLGSARKDSVITVQSDASMLCNQQMLWNVNWSVAASGTQDVQLCPTGFTGVTKRQCTKSRSGVTVWKDPDFSNCLSGGILAIQRHIESLKTGYHLRSVNFLLERLFEYLQSIRANMHPSEGNPVLEMLGDVNALVAFDKYDYSIWKIFMDIADLLLSSNLIRYRQKLMELQSLVTECNKKYASNWMSGSSRTEKYNGTSFVVELLRLPSNEMNFLNSPKENAILEVNDSLESNLIDSLEMHLRAEVNSVVQSKLSIIVSVVFYRNLSNFVETGESFDITNSSTERVISRFMSVSIVGEDGFDVEDVLFSAKFYTSHLNHESENGNNISCAAIEFNENDRNVLFDSKPCITQLINRNVLLCRCFGPGLYAIVPRNKDSKILERPDMKIWWVVSGCLACVAVLLLFMICGFLRTW